MAQRFLVDASLPRSAAEVLRRNGQEVVDVRDIGMRSAADEAIAAHARENRMVLVTRDFDFADIRNYPPSEHTGLVVLQLPEDATAARVTSLLESFLRDPSLVERLPGCLAIVEFGRVRFRSA